MTRTYIRPASRDEWLAIRQGGIGSSEVATIVGLNPFETPYQLWRRKVGLDGPKEENFAMKAGHYLEDAVARFWADETGKEIIKRSAIDWIIRRDDKPYMQVSPDRTYWLDGSRKAGNKGILECKTTQKEIDGDDLPKHWFVQVQYQLGVAGYENGSIAWLSAGRTFGYRDLKLVPDFYAWLEESVEKFYTDNVLGKVEPESVDVEDVLLKYGRHADGKILEVGEDVYAEWCELKRVREELEKLESARDELETSLKCVFGDAESISYMGQTLATWKAPKPSVKFDSKRFQAEHPDMSREYMQPFQGARRFILK